MNFSVVWERLAFLLVHVTVFELPLVLFVTILTSLGLARVLDKHNARLREAKFARRAAAFYAGLFVILYLARAILT